MEVKAQYTIEAALLTPLLIVVLMTVFTVSGRLYREHTKLVSEIAAQQLEASPHKAVRRSYQKGELLWKLNTNEN